MKRSTVLMNQLQEYARIFDGVEPFSGPVPRGYSVDFMGVLTDARFRAYEGIDPSATGGRFTSTEPPVIGKEVANAEGWFEAVNWFAAAREAHGRFVMMTLGANWGAQAVGAARALQLVNPLPYKLVAVEPIPENMAFVRQHMRDNGIEPDEQWLVEMAISSDNAPVLFPVGTPGLGAQNCLSTNHPDMRAGLAEELIAAGRAEQALRNLINDNTTGVHRKLVQSLDFTGEVKFVSTVTLSDLLGPFDVVDYLESDIQQSEILVFPPFLHLLKRKVRRIHIGTHGTDVHWSLHDLFRQEGWDVVFSYEPNGVHDSALGRFETNDGILTLRNPVL